MKLLGLAVVLALAFPGTAGTLVGPATIEVNGRPLSFTQREGYSIRRASLTDRNGRTVGRSYLICFTISKFERGCRGAYTFPRGVITVAGPVQDNGYVLAVTGGTGLYNNARGAMKVTPSGAQTRHRVFFQLIG
ncbi:MAG: hypothetical protein H0U53_10915 [Actinobacteria bacterium]|nr:hypothetical protein [Actinomycetota bacterium]